MLRSPWPATRGAATAAKALAVTVAATVAAVALTLVAAGPAMAAAQAQVQSPAAPAKVKYYVVPPRGHGSVPTLYSIAAATLGNGSLFMEIFNLNKGRLQPNGQRLESPHSVEPGWILLLPPSASGPGVHFGPLPTAAKTAARVARRHPARAHAAAAASPAAASAGYGSGAIAETVIGGALVVFAVAGLGLMLRRRRRPGAGNRSGSGRRASSRSRWPGPRSPRPAHTIQDGPGSDWVRSLATDNPGDAASHGGAPPGAGGPGWPHAGHPSSPASDLGRPVQGPGYGRIAASDGQDWAYPDHPSWPANSTGRPLTPDHPSWPASDIGPPVAAAADYGRTDGPDRPGWPYPDHPSWPASDLGRPVADDDDYPSWPATDPGGGWAGPGGPAARPGGPPPGGGAGLPQRERPGTAAAPAVHHDPAPRQPVPPVPPARGRHVRIPAGHSGRPGPDGPADDPPQRWSAQLARTTGPIPQTYYDLAFGDGRLQVMLTEPPGANQGWAGPANVLQLTGADTGQQGPVAWQSADPGSADSVRLAQRVLADADQQAAAIRQEASSQAVAIREAAEQEAAEIKEQAAAEAAPIREAATQEAVEIKQQAAAQVAAIREAAEREIAELRATVLAMSDELSRVAAYVTENLTNPGQPVASPPRQAGPHTLTTPAKPPAAPDAKPSATPDDKPAGRPAGKAGAKPGAKRTTRPATRPARPAARPTTKPVSRQSKVMRKMAWAIAAVSVIGAISGTTELALHGGPFFILRANGAGAGETGPKEPVNPELPKKAGEVQCSLLHLACTLK